MKQLILSILFLMQTWICAYSQNEKRALMDANSTYKNENFEDAENRYRTLDPKDPSLKEISEFNLADALYRQGKFEEAAEIFGKLARESQDADIRSKSFHNEGNSHVAAKDYGKAVESYKSALRLDSNAEDTRYNLAYARKMIQQQEQQQQNQQNQQGQNQDQQNQDKGQQEQNKQDQNKQDQDQQGDKNKDNQKPQEGDQDKQGDQGKEPKPSEQQGKEQISKEDAERILKALENAESDLQKKLRKPEGKAQKKKIEKDW